MLQSQLDQKKREKKIGLISVPFFYKKDRKSFDHTFCPPLALGILFSQLKKGGYNICQDDLSIRFHRNNFSTNGDKRFKHDLFFQEERIRAYAKTGEDDELEEEIIGILESSPIDYRGINIWLISIPETTQNSSNILFTLALSKFLKKRYMPYIVLGGHGFSIELLVSKYTLDGIVDFIVTGEGEEAVIDVVDKILQEDGKEFSKKVRIIHKPTNIIVAPDFSGLSLENYSLTFLDYKELSADNEAARDFFASDVLVLQYKFIKGCPNKCAFCESSGIGLRAVSKPKEVVDAIELMQKKFKPTGYFFLSDTINISKSYVTEICDEICRRNLKILWSDCATARGIDEEVLEKMKKSGCIRLIFGMETASPDMLKRVNKEIKLDELEHVLKIASGCGIWTGVEVICGLPHETDADIKLTIDFLLKNKDYIDKIYCNMFDLRPSSMMRLYPQDYGIENIREVNLHSDLANFVQFSFDEVNGLKWEDKKRQIIESFSRIAGETKSLCDIPNYLQEHLLFYLYDNFHDKTIIKKHYVEIKRFFNSDQS